MGLCHRMRRDAVAVVEAAGSDADSGLTQAEAASRLSTYGTNEIVSEKPPSVWAVALLPAARPDEHHAGGRHRGQHSHRPGVDRRSSWRLLIVLNVGPRHAAGAHGAGERRRPVQDAGAAGQGGARWRRALVPATEVVPGDIVQVEAGDIVPADGRIVRSATLEAQEAALTGESAPIAKDAGGLASADVALGDRTNMLFQNTSVTRGTGSMVVTATGHADPDGPDRHDADGSSRGRGRRCRKSSTRSPRCLASSPGGGRRHRRRRAASAACRQDLLLLGTAMAISAIPTGLPAFVSGLLSIGAKQLAEAKAVVKNLTDVETLGATSAINTDKTGTLTMNQMMVSTLYASGSWFKVEGEGYRKTGAILGRGCARSGLHPAGLGLSLDSDAVVQDDGSVIGDPTEAALVVLAAKFGVDADETRRAYPRLAEVPFDSEYKFMATFHRVDRSMASST